MEYLNYEIMYEVIDTIVYGYCENDPHLQGMIDMYLMLNWDKNNETFGITVMNAIDVLINDNAEQCKEMIRLCDGDTHQIAIEQQYYNKRLDFLIRMKNEISDYLEEVANNLID